MMRRYRATVFVFPIALTLCSVRATAQPALTAASFANAGSGQAGALSPCSLATITAAGLAPDGAADLFSAPIFGPLPTSKNGIAVYFANTLAPLSSLTLVNGQPRLTVQVPCEIAPANSVPVTVKVGVAAGTVNLPVFAAAPGIFEVRYSDGAVRAVALRSDGSFVTLNNPARRGEFIRIYVTGLGPSAPLAGTNQVENPGADLIGADAVASGAVVVGIIGYGGVIVNSARVAANLIGVFEVEFLVPTDAPQGDNVAFAVGVVPAGSTLAISSLNSAIPIDDPSGSTVFSRGPRASTRGGSRTVALASSQPGLAVTAGSFANAGSGQSGFLSPCSLATITATGLNPNGAADLFPAPIFGPLPTSKNGISVYFNNTLAAPISSLTLVNGQPQLTIQVPCEVAPASSVPVTVNVGTASLTVNLPVLAAAPGIFQVPYPDGTMRAVALRDDGSFVTLGNPARPGETIRIYLTGLGPSIPSTSTNQVDNPGAGLQAVATGTVVVGINQYGVTVSGARLAANLIGLFEVAFIVPADAPQGNNLPLAVGVVPAGSATAMYSLASSIPIGVGSAPAITGVTNAASYAAGPISPGEIISIFANPSNAIGPAIPIGLSSDTCPSPCTSVPTTMGGVQVEFLPLGVYAPLTYVSAGQINCVIPYQIAGIANPSVEVKYAGQASNAFMLRTAATAPAIFTANNTGTGPAAVTQYDAGGTFQGYNTSSNPAGPGWYLILYVTGEGYTSAAGTGEVTSTVDVLPLLGPPKVWIDGLPAAVTYYAEAYGFVSGLMQVNLQIPQGVHTGQADTISLSIGANTAQSGVTVYIR